MSKDAAQDYLQAQFGHDADLLAEARAILDGGLDSDDFLSSGNGAPSAPVLADGAQFGPYRVRRLLGRGGMGAVFLADQKHPERAVALKVLESALLSERAHARFGYEVQALARLRHRGIAQIYETGVQTLNDGLLSRTVPWFAMEYVEGASTLLDYVISNELSTADRLHLFLEVCDAVHHGHQKGVVHRDLKPENILVDAAGHTKVIDFGVARGLDVQAGLTAHTGPAEIVGTLPYLSPERVTAGSEAADVRTDVYALGVVLYQLLTNRLPIEVDPADIVTSARRICETPPPRPSAQVATLPADLDAIVLKVLAKDPDARYASVAALADDLRAFLEHRPISARPPGTWYQLRLFARRHRALVVSAASVLVIAVTAAAVSISWALHSKRAEQQASEERAEAIEQRSRGEKLFDTVFKRSFQTTLREAPKLHKMPGGPERVKAMMDAVLEDLRVLESMSEDNPRVQVLVAEAWLKLGDTQGNWVYENFGDRDAAESSYRHALGICESVLAKHPTHRSTRLTRIRSRVRLGEILDQAERALRAVGKKDPALRKERQALLAQALSEATVLYAAERKDGAAARNLADCHARLGRLAMDEGQFEVVREHARALADLHAAGHVDSAISGLKLHAWSYFRAKDWKASTAAWARVVEVGRQAADAPDAPYPTRFEHAQHLSAHGESALQSGLYEAAIESMSQALRLLQQLSDESPKDRRVGMQQQIQYRGLARAYEARAKDEPERRVEWLRKARGALVDSGRLLGEPKDDNRRRAMMRKMLVKAIEALDAKIGE